MVLKSFSCLFCMSTSSQFLYSIMSAIRNIVRSIYHYLPNTKGIFSLRWTKDRQRTVCITSYTEARSCKYSCCEKLISIKHFRVLISILICSYRTRYCCQIVIKLDFFDRFSKNPQIEKGTKIRPVEGEVFRTDTDTRRNEWHLKQ